MNIPIFIAGCITTLAFFAHTFVGIKEVLSTSPIEMTTKDSLQNYETLRRCWTQSMCAFQMVTIDLLVLSVLLIVLSVTGAFEAKRSIILALSGFYLLWTIAWFIQLLLLKSKPKDFLFLSQWAFWLICSGLLYWGAQTV